MKKISIIGITLSLLLGFALWSQTRKVEANGRTGAGQQTGEPFQVPAVAGGGFHSLALKSNGTVAAWGNNAYEQVTVASTLTFGSQRVVAWGRNNFDQTNVPAGLSGVTTIAAGWYHNLALKSDGTVAAWGNNGEGETNVPAGLSGVTTISAGAFHNLALTGDGTVVAWGSNLYGETNVPADLSGVMAIAGGGSSYSLALKSDGTVVAWGNNIHGQTDVPPGLSGVTAIAAGYYHNLVLKSDGTVVAWGWNLSGQTDVPAGLSGVTAIAAGGFHNLALKSDGTVVAWGDNLYEQTNVPPGLSDVTAIAAGGFHNLALKSDGTVVAWGRNSFDQTDVPAGLSGVAAIAAGWEHSLALSVSNNTAPTITANPVPLTEGSEVPAIIVATVYDYEDDESTLNVTITPQSGFGVVMRGLSIDTSGNVTAEVEVVCNASESRFTLRVTDSGGLFAETTLTFTITPETIPPTITCPANVVAYLPLNSMNTGMIVDYPDPTVSDNCTTMPTVTTSPGSGSIFPVGVTTVTVTATDGEDNQSTCSFTVTVRYNFGDFLQPVDNPPMVNTAVAGSSIPVKFSLSGNKGSAIFAASYPVSQAIACNTGSPTDVIEETVSVGSSSLSYNATTDQYKYVWKTEKAWKGTCRKLTLKFNDGTTHEALFQFK